MWIPYKYVIWRGKFGQTYRGHTKPFSSRLVPQQKGHFIVKPNVFPIEIKILLASLCNNVVIVIGAHINM